jgi:histidyl-tRNA synthetase
MGINDFALTPFYHIQDQKYLKYLPFGNRPAKAQANQNALTAGRAAIKTATKDLNDARNRANTIAKELRKLGIKTNVGLGNASTTAAINAATAASTTMGL